MLSSLVRCSSQCTDWSEQQQQQQQQQQQHWLYFYNFWKAKNKNKMRKKGFSFFSRDDRLKTWNIPDIPIHEVHSPEIRRGLKVSLSAETALEKVEMPPKKKRKVESNKPTQGNKQGKTKNYRLVVIVLSTMTEWHAKIGFILSCQAWPTAQRQQSWFAEGPEEWASFSVYIASSKHEGGSVNSRQLCKPERQSIEGLHNFEEYGV